jgi:hypothetical protein
MGRNGSMLKLSGFPSGETRDGWPSEQNAFHCDTNCKVRKIPNLLHVNPPSRARDRKEGRKAGYPSCFPWPVRLLATGRELVLSEPSAQEIHTSRIPPSRLWKRRGWAKLSLVVSTPCAALASPDESCRGAREVHNQRQSWRRRRRFSSSSCWLCWLRRENAAVGEGFLRYRRRTCPRPLHRRATVGTITGAAPSSRGGGR